MLTKEASRCSKRDSSFLGMTNGYLLSLLVVTLRNEGSHKESDNNPITYFFLIN